MKRMILAALALLLWATALPVSVAAAEGRGMDVSVFQGEIDFARVRASGVDTVYIRAAEGFVPDARFRENAVQARRAGLAVGFYHFITPRNEAQARQLARYFADLIRPYTYECRPAADYEQFGDLAPDETDAIALAYLAELEARTGARPLFYTDANNAARRWGDDLARYPLWVAAYGGEPTDLGPWEAWTGFQYSDEGRVPGVPDRVDLDRFREGAWLTGRETRPASPARNQTEFWYTVRRGDTLWGLARRFDTTVGELVRLNGIADPDRIYAGERLRIPDPTGEHFRYEVGRGDTLSALARRFGATVATLARDNSIADPDRIYVGEILRIPR